MFLRFKRWTLLTSFLPLTPLAAPVIYRQLTDLFNLSLKSREFPDERKLAKVSPVFKVGERKDPNNYRPISVYIHGLWKASLKYEQIDHYLITNDILDQRQSGLRSLHSTVTALLHSTVTALLDLTNRWGTVQYSGSRASSDKIRIYQSSWGYALEWFKSYLFNGFQVVYINGVLSEKSTLKCGVPRGSMPGPLLFLVYINDISTIICNGLCIYTNVRR